MGPVSTVESVADLARRWKAEGARVVLADGCFDLVRGGELSYLEDARRCGDVLVVAVFDDGYVRRTKGKGRPLSPLSERAEVVAALRPVDVAVALDGVEPEEFAARLRPDAYAVRPRGLDADGGTERVVLAAAGKVVECGDPGAPTSDEVIAMLRSRRSGT